MDHTDAFYYFTSTPRQAGKSWMQERLEQDRKPAWIGVDWAADSGMNRGDIIKHDGNVTHVRFKQAGI